MGGGLGGGVGGRALEEGDISGGECVRHPGRGPAGAKTSKDWHLFGVAQGDKTSLSSF